MGSFMSAMGHKRTLHAWFEMKEAAIEATSSRSLRAALRGYFNSLSILAQASATLLLGDAVPGNVAQPPFSINESCFHESISFSWAKVALASVACWNFSTQIGARAATIALFVL